MHIKATIVAFAFSVQYFENATIVAYAGLRVKCCIPCSGQVWKIDFFQAFGERKFGE